ncbi:MAG: GNAT family N-acetyltransferase [Candidatus Latescibacteria bacterium]|nr:GNAT family N-acetyltransferase [Candidatus Latescibacterota bacterium]
MKNKSVEIRQFRAADSQALKDLTVAAFGENSSIDKRIEDRFGAFGLSGWKPRKASHIDADIEANADGIFVAELDGVIVGYITTTLDHDGLIGRIPNMAVGAQMQGQGVGRKLLEEALDYFRRQGMKAAKIETLASNETGQHLYPSVGFEEIARQVHFVMRLD